MCKFVNIIHVIMIFTTTSNKIGDTTIKKNKSKTNSDASIYQIKTLQCKSTYIGETSRNKKSVYL